MNDIFDKNQDKQHPIKKNRPIASGKISVYHALIFAFILFVSGLGGGDNNRSKTYHPDIMLRLN